MPKTAWQDLPESRSLACCILVVFKIQQKNLSRTNIVHIFVQIISIMVVANISDFRKDIKSYLDRVAKNFETLIINRGKDSGIVIMSLEEYNSLIATNYELSSRTNEKRLDSAIEKLKSGKSFSKDLIGE
jgi:antitoxin YefM